MKLTLRTLLAYIDNLLPPHDAEEFEALLNENPAANNLCSRIRSVMSRPELGAPDVLDKGLHLDPNVTAEYLDNVLSSEESPEYERLCISSDRQLGEVSACHQILTVVQIEPAEVDPAWREKIYTAPEQVSEEESVDLDGGVEAPAPSSSGFMASLSGILSGASGILGGGQSLKLNLDRKAQAPPVEKSEPIPEPPTPQTPPAFHNQAHSETERPAEPPVDNQSNMANPQAALEQYAQMITPEIETQEKPRQNALTWILSLVSMAALVILFVFLFLGPKNKSKTEVANNDNAAVTEETESDKSKTKNDQLSTESSKDSETANPAVPADDSKQTATENNNEDELPPSNLDSDDSEAPELEPLETDEPLSPLTDEEQPVADDQTDSPSDFEANETDQPSDTDNLPAIDQTELDDTFTADENNVPNKGVDESKPITENEAENDNPQDAFDEAPQPMVEVGKFAKRNGVDSQLLAFKANGSGETWRRMSEGAAIRSNDTLAAFPDYRPDVTLGNGARLRLVGPAKVSISPKSTPEDIHLTLEYGRMILATNSPQKIVVKCANLPAELEINQPSVTVAFETDVLKRGDNPALTPSKFYGTISLLKGNVNLLYKGSSSAVSSPTFIDCQSGTLNPQGAASDWIQNKNEPSADLEKRLTGNKPIGVTLTEIVDNKTISKELRQTALVSLSMLGRYSTLIEDFNKEDRFAVWMDDFIILQDAIFKSPDNAQSVQNELANRYDKKGERIYEILWKYHNDLSNEDISSLIHNLRDETLSLRVAAFCLLKSRGINLGAYKPSDLKKSETILKSLENKYRVSPEF